MEIFSASADSGGSGIKREYMFRKEKRNDKDSYKGNRR